MPVFGDEQKLQVSLDLDLTQAEQQLNYLRQKIVSSFQSAITPIVNQLQSAVSNAATQLAMQGASAQQIAGFYSQIPFSAPVPGAGTPIFAPPQPSLLQYITRITPEQTERMQRQIAAAAEGYRPLTPAEITEMAFAAVERPLFIGTGVGKFLRGAPIFGTAFYALNKAQEGKIRDITQNLHSVSGVMKLLKEGTLYDIKWMTGLDFVEKGLQEGNLYKMWAGVALGAGILLTPFFGVPAAIAGGIAAVGTMAMDYASKKARRWFLKKYGTKAEWEEYVRSEMYQLDKEAEQRLRNIAKGLELPTNMTAIEAMIETADQMKTMLEDMQKWAKKPEERINIVQKFQEMLGPSLMGAWLGPRGPWTMEEMTKLAFAMETMKQVPEGSREGFNAIARELMRQIETARGRLARIRRGEETVSETERELIEQQAWMFANVNYDQLRKTFATLSKEYKEEDMPKRIAEFLVSSGQITIGADVRTVLRKVSETSRLLMQEAAFSGRTLTDVFNDVTALYQRFGIADVGTAIRALGILHQTTMATSLPTYSLMPVADTMFALLRQLHVLPRAGADPRFNRLALEAIGGAGGYIKRTVAQMATNANFRQIAMYELGGPIAASEKLLTGTAQVLMYSPITQLAALHYAANSYAPVGGIGALALTVGNITSIDDYFRFKDRLRQGIGKTLMHSSKAFRSMRFVFRDMLSSMGATFNVRNVKGLLMELFHQPEEVANALAIEIVQGHAKGIEPDVEFQALRNIKEAIDSGKFRDTIKYQYTITTEGVMKEIAKNKEVQHTMAMLNKGTIGIGDALSRLKLPEEQAGKIIRALQEAFKTPTELGQLEAMVKTVGRTTAPEKAYYEELRKILAAHGVEAEKLSISQLEAIYSIVSDVLLEGKKEIFTKGKIYRTDIDIANRSKDFDLTDENLKKDIQQAREIKKALQGKEEVDPSSLGLVIVSKLDKMIELMQDRSSKSEAVKIDIRR